MVTYKAKGVIPDRDPWFAGVFTNGALEKEMIDQADLIITAGLDRVELLPRSWTFSQPVVEFDEVERRRYDWDPDAVQRLVASEHEQIRAVRSVRLQPDQVVTIASAALPHARVTVDAGAHMFPATLLWPVDEPNGMLISNGLSTMGFAVPAAVGAALVDRERPVVALTGDGGLLMCTGELLTLVRERLRVIVVVFNDRSLSLIDVKQRQRRLESNGVSLGGVGWTSIAEGLGMAAHRATTAGEVERAVAAAREHPGPTLIDAHVDPAPYADVLRIVRG